MSPTKAQSTSPPATNNNRTSSLVSSPKARCGMSAILIRTYYGTSISCTTFATVCMVISFATNHWEVIWYDTQRMLATVDATMPDVRIDVVDAQGDGNGYYVITYTPGAGNNTSAAFTTALSNNVSSSSTVKQEASSAQLRGTLPPKRYLPMRVMGGLWTTCDTVDDETRERLEKSDGVLHPKCESYLYGYYNESDFTHHPYLDMYKDPVDLSAAKQRTFVLMSLSRSAAACAIVAMTTLLAASFLGSFAAIRQQIIFAMIAGVCFFASGLYTFFTVALMLLREANITEDTTHLPYFAAQARKVDTGWSMFLGWATFFLCIAAGISWTMLSMELKKTRMNYMYSSNYDQICSM